jgi:2-hydroxychromene-2-carboxylate isomerase
MVGLSRSLVNEGSNGLAKPAASIIARATSADGNHLLQQATDAARKLGIFGAPTFAIGEEIFWGDDRLEDALDFASRRVN